MWQQQQYAEDVVAREYRSLSFMRRLVLRWVSPDLARAARDLSEQPRGHVNVPLMQQSGPFARMGDRMAGKH